MRRTISSEWTFFMKLVFPVFWIGGFAIATVLLFLAKAGPPAAGALRWVFLFATAAGTAFIYWSCIRLKRVELDDQALTLSDYRNSFVVPLHEVAEVTQNLWLNLRPITVRFRRDIGCGESIVFIPKIRRAPYFSCYPIVKELQDAVACAQGN